MLRIWVTLVLLACALTGAGQPRKDHRDYVPDEKTAVQIAEAVLIAQFGEERVKARLPLRADGSNKDHWVVAGTRPPNERPKFGGGLTVWINKHTGCIVNVLEHTK